MAKVRSSKLRMIEVDGSAVDRSGVSERNVDVLDEPRASHATAIHHFASVPQSPNPSELSDDLEISDSE